MPYFLCSKYCYEKIILSAKHVSVIGRGNTTLNFQGVITSKWYGKILLFSLFKACVIWKDYTILPIQGVCNMKRSHYSPYSRRVWYGKIALFSLFKACVIWKDHTILPIQGVCNMKRSHYSPYSGCVWYGKIMLFSL